MRKKAFILAIISIVYIVGYPLLKNKVLDAKYMIEISITGESCELSKGTEIWIDSIWMDGAEVDLSGLTLGEYWENRGRLFNPGTKPAEWTVLIRSKESTRIDFVTHPFSGKIRITDYQGNVTEMDLYSAEEGKKSFQLNY